MWSLLARCPAEELDDLITALGLRERVTRGQPIDTLSSASEEFEWDWGLPFIDGEGKWRFPFIRAEHADSICVAERSGLRLPPTGITIVDRRNSMMWLNRLSSPRVGFRRVEYRSANGVSPPLSKDAAVRQAIKEGLRGQLFANRVCELCQVKRDADGFGIRNLQLIAQKLSQAQ